jgi:hypothetical protein
MECLRQVELRSVLRVLCINKYWPTEQERRPTRLRQFTYILVHGAFECPNTFIHSLILISFQPIVISDSHWQHVPPKYLCIEIYKI